MGKQAAWFEDRALPRLGRLCERQPFRSWRRFDCLSGNGAKTTWLFRQKLGSCRAIDNLFACFDKHLSRSGRLAKGGRIVEATIIQAPRQHSGEEEKPAINAGEIREGWKDNPA
ncbi:hypothetical protein [Hoeflea sp. EC-HK425]|uniref:hypothetical protein n=1 Tax=Hoeflea sp. EC-HK425 TaxID=2038388 RepID=UPI001AEFA50D|nr:hypothetical protein [Hoeflea sp. EC-HK425]